MNTGRKTQAVLRVISIVSLLAMAVQPVTACDPESELKQYLSRKHPDGAQVLALDHVAKRLVAYDWKNKELTSTTAVSLDRLETDRPLLRRTKLPLVVVVMNTNPVVFRVAQTESAQVDSASLESLKVFLSAFSGFTVTTVTQVAQNALTAKKSNIQQQEKILGKVRPDQITRMSDLPDGVAALSSELRRASKDVAPPFNALKKAAGELKGDIETIDDAGGRLTSYAQLVELGDRHAQRPQADLSSLPEDIDRAMADVETALHAVKDPPCVDIVTALGRAIRIKLEGLPVKPVEANRLRDEFAHIVANLITAECDDDDIEAPVVAIAKWLKDFPVEATAPPPDVRDVLLIAEDKITEYTDFATNTGKIAKGARGLLEKRGSAILNASSLALVIQRVNEIPYIEQDPCAAIAGVVEVPRDRDSTANLPFGKEGNETLKIEIDGPFDKVTLKHGNDLEQKFAVARKAWIDPDIDMALTYTHLVEPEFDLVENAAKEKIITRTKETTRAGQLAMMLTARFPGLPVTRYVAPQLGFLVSTGNPGAFAGLAVQLGPYFKASAGTTYQRVTKLPRGWSEGQEAPDGAQKIQTRNGFDHRGYIALSITLDNISFFKSE